MLMDHVENQDYGVLDRCALLARATRILRKTPRPDYIPYPGLPDSKNPGSLLQPNQVY